jgi:hypothetical protein
MKQRLPITLAVVLAVGTGALQVPTAGVWGLWIWVSGFCAGGLVALAFWVRWLVEVRRASAPPRMAHLAGGPMDGHAIPLPPEGPLPDGMAPQGVDGQYVRVNEDPPAYVWQEVGDAMRSDDEQLAELLGEVEQLHEELASPEANLVLCIQLVESIERGLVERDPRLGGPDGEVPTPEVRYLGKDPEYVDARLLFALMRGRVALDYLSEDEVRGLGLSVVAALQAHRPVRLVEADGGKGASGSA